MIDREKLRYYENILSLHNKNTNLDKVYKIVTTLKENDMYHFFQEVSDLFNDIPTMKHSLHNILEANKDSNEYQFYSNLLGITNKELDTHLLYNVLNGIRHYKDLEADILDSFSNNQFASKGALLKAIEDLDILQDHFQVVLWGSWYGSILIPGLKDKVKKIMAVDLDERVGKIAKNMFFEEYENVKFHASDVFTYKNDYIDTNLFINTSCEHMSPMKDWKWFGAGAMRTDKDTSMFKTPKIADECYFAFQSNNMFGIEGHINCVNSIDEFKDQLPERAEVLYQEEVEDTRGTRYMLVGKFNPL